MNWKIEGTKFIECHLKIGEPVMFNPAGIAAFGIYGNGTDGAWISLIGQSEEVQYHVRESYEQIKAAIQG